MSTTETTMPRPKKSAGSEPPTKAVKIDRALATKAALIAADRGASLADYFSEAIRGVVEKDWARVIRKAGGGE